MEAAEEGQIKLKRPTDWYMLLRAVVKLPLITSDKHQLTVYFYKVPVIDLLFDQEHLQITRIQSFVLELDHSIRDAVDHKDIVQIFRGVASRTGRKHRWQNHSHD